mgnify:CR=1 FL=1
MFDPATFIGDAEFGKTLLFSCSTEIHILFLTVVMSTFFLTCEPYDTINIGVSPDLAFQDWSPIPGFPGFCKWFFHLCTSLISCFSCFSSIRFFPYEYSKHLKCIISRLCWGKNLFCLSLLHGWKKNLLHFSADAFYDSYHEILPRTPKFSDRHKIYQLFHLLNHLLICKNNSFVFCLVSCICYFSHYLRKFTSFSQMGWSTTNMS